jgi:hypothetical protein
VILRAWMEGTGPGDLRVRMTHASDVTGTEQPLATASTIEEARTVVRGWLDYFVACECPA